MSEQEIDIESFTPTNRQKIAKQLLHSNVNQQIIGTLTPENMSRLRMFLYPITLDEILRWHTSDSRFWVWFKISNVHFSKIEELKKKAVGSLSAIIDGEFDDAKAAGVRLNAAKLVLDFDNKPQTNVTANTMNVTARNGIPKALAKKSNEEIQAEILKISEAHNLD